MDSPGKYRNLSGAAAVSLTGDSQLIKFMAEKRSGGWIKWTIIILACIGLIGFGIWFFFKRGGEDAPQYQTITVVRGDLTQMVTATGTLNPVTNILVGCQVSGTIQKIFVDYNSIVKAGQLIAQIDPSTYQAQVNQAKADLANAKANLELQQVEAKRSAELFTNNLVSGSDYDTANATRDEAAAMVQIKEAALTNTLANLGYCKIYSPIDGIVIVNNIQVGQTVAASFNTPELFQIAYDLTKMQIDSSVAEADVGGVLEEQSVDFTVDAYPTRTFRGTVTQVRNAPATVNNVVTYDCVIGVTNADYKLKPGMTANVSIIVAQRKNILNIPNAALRFHLPDNAIVQTNSTVSQSPQTTNSGSPASASNGPGHHNGSHGHGERAVFHTVYVLSGEGDDAKLQAVQVKTGISDGISTEVLSGLDEGAQVVTSAVSTGTHSATAASSFGSGFPRMH
jgi:HlyD family secretion protein